MIHMWLAPRPSSPPFSFSLLLTVHLPPPYQSVAYIWVGSVIFVIYDKLSLKLIRPLVSNDAMITRVSDSIVRVEVSSRGGGGGGSGGGGG